MLLLCNISVLAYIWYRFVFVVVAFVIAFTKYKRIFHAIFILQLAIHDTQMAMGQIS